MYKRAAKGLQRGQELRVFKQVAGAGATAIVARPGAARSKKATPSAGASPPLQIRVRNPRLKVRKPGIDPVRLRFYEQLRGKTSVEGSLRPGEKLPDWLAAEIQNRGLANWLARMGQRRAIATRLEKPSGQGLRAKGAYLPPRRAAAKTAATRTDEASLSERRRALPRIIQAGGDRQLEGVPQWIRAEVAKLGGPTAWVRRWRRQLS